MIVDPGPVEPEDLRVVDAHPLPHEEEQAEKKRGRAKTMSAMSPKLPQRAFILDDSCRNSNACPN